MRNIETDYLKCLHSFDTAFVAHMPKSLPKNAVNYECGNINSPKEFGGYAGINTTCKFGTKDDYLNQKKLFTEKSKYHLKSQDSSIFIINIYGEIVNNYVNGQSDSLMPIPQYAICETSDSLIGWKRIINADIFVLDYKLIDLFSRKNIKSEFEMPKGYEYGYVYGFTTNDKDTTIRYWLMIW